MFGKIPAFFPVREQLEQIDLADDQPIHALVENTRKGLTNCWEPCTRKSIRRLTPTLLTFTNTQ